MISRITGGEDFLYEKYFSIKKDTVMSILQRLKNTGQSIAVWSAGQKGKEFLQIYDPHCKIVSAVFDKDESKYGMKMPTGHDIVDYRQFSVDVVILVDDAHQIESRTMMLKLTLSQKFLFIDDVVFGELSLEECLDMPTKWNVVHKENTKVAGLTILYNPDEKLLSNIKSYVNQVDVLYVYDNSPNPHADLFDNYKENIRYIFADGKNHGLGFPINKIAKKCLNENFDWLITFDQDSFAPSNMINKLKDYICSDMFDKDIAVIAPVIRHKIFGYEGDDNYLPYLPIISYKRMAIQSGALHNLHMLEEIGGYDESLFVYQVDNEYCTRCRLAGYKIAQFNKTFLLHQIGQAGKSVKINGREGYILHKFTPTAYYYNYRNSLYCMSKYRDIEPVFSIV